MVSDNQRHDESEGESIYCKYSRCGLSSGIVILYISFNKEKPFPEVECLSVRTHFDDEVSYLTDAEIDENDGTVASAHF